MAGGTSSPNPASSPPNRFAIFRVSEDAKRFYKSGQPVLQRLLPFWLASLVDRAKVMLIPVIMLMMPLMRVAPPLMRWRTRRKSTSGTLTCATSTRDWSPVYRAPSSTRKTSVSRTSSTRSLTSMSRSATWRSFITCGCIWGCCSSTSLHYGRHRRAVAARWPETNTSMHRC